MVCRQLGIRSILIVPVLKEQELLGVFEVFSPQPYAFGDRDVQTLHALSQRAVDSIMRSAEAVSPRRAKPIVETVPANVPVPVPVVAAGARRRDPWTSALTVVVVLLAVLLGWILGHDGWKRTVRSMKTKTAPAKTYPQPERLNDIPAASDDETAPAVRRNAANPAPGNLVVYQNGKIIYGANSPQAPGEGPQIVLPPEVAEQSLKQRIEPVYPDAAREQRIQGQVLLAATIGKDGTVQELQVLSGDPQLAIAAGDAVRQWHFRPLIKAGKPSGFQTQITMDFRLPNL
jgi:TonB family protein